jgi:hypothetical protein
VIWFLLSSVLVLDRHIMLAMIVHVFDRDHPGVFEMIA